MSIINKLSVCNFFRDDSEGWSKVDPRFESICDPRCDPENDQLHQWFVTSFRVFGLSFSPIYDFYTSQGFKVNKVLFIFVSDEINLKEKLLRFNGKKGLLMYATGHWNCIYNSIFIHGKVLGL